MVTRVGDDSVDLTCVE